MKKIFSKNNLLAIAVISTLCTFSTHPLHSEEAKPDEEGKTIYSSVEERRLHALMQEERNNLLKNKKVLDLREKELKTLEAAVDKKLGEIDKKLEELQKMQAKIKELLADKKAEELKKVQSLGKIYEKMVPAKAALALSGMDQQLATDLLAAMKPKAAAKVLNMLDRKKAAELSTTFSTIQLE
jgi:flagellar motility protein MotE (MotC chaperone)